MDFSSASNCDWFQDWKTLTSSSSQRPVEATTASSLHVISSGSEASQNAPQCYSLHSSKKEKERNVDKRQNETATNFAPSADEAQVISRLDECNNEESVEAAVVLYDVDVESGTPSGEGSRVVEPESVTTNNGTAESAAAAQSGLFRELVTPSKHIAPATISATISPVLKQINAFAIHSPVESSVKKKKSDTEEKETERQAAPAPLTTTSDDEEVEEQEEELVGDVQKEENLVDSPELVEELDLCDDGVSSVPAQARFVTGEEEKFMDDAESFLDSERYRYFLQVISNFKDKSLGIYNAVVKVCEIFNGARQWMERFNVFLPEEHKLDDVQLEALESTFGKSESTAIVEDDTTNWHSRKSASQQSAFAAQARSEIAAEESNSSETEEPPNADRSSLNPTPTDVIVGTNDEFLTPPSSLREQEPFDPRTGNAVSPSKKRKKRVTFKDDEEIAQVFEFEPVRARRTRSQTTFINASLPAKGEGVAGVPFGVPLAEDFDVQEYLAQSAAVKITRAKSKTFQIPVEKGLDRSRKRRKAAGEQEEN